MFSFLHSVRGYVSTIKLYPRSKKFFYNSYHTIWTLSIGKDIVTSGIPYPSYITYCNFRSQQLKKTSFTNGDLGLQKLTFTQTCHNIDLL